MGVVGQSPVLQVYPSIGLEWLWNTTDATPLDPLLASSSLAVDAQGNLVAVSHSDQLYKLSSHHFLWKYSYMRPTEPLSEAINKLSSAFAS